MKQSENLSLNLPEDDDFFDVEHQNENMRKLDEKIGDIIIPNEIQGTLSVGQTELVLSSEKISADSTIDIYTDVYGVSPNTATVADGSITMTFKAQTKSVRVKVVVK